MSFKSSGFNETDAAKDATVSAAELGLGKGQYAARDLWQHDQRDGDGDGSVRVTLAPHATALYRISAR
ncbi:MULTISPECIES: hypothetical protein [unclassified Lysobacter]|uniref:hypothetical protein n=1 Tax=unclassified Lysobacter TaxID=2635362 RepID=UPI001BECD7E5|nr:MULTISPECIES: hypothetical protein [unclassified Lysobacter]MBT2745773.1 hypothetical protein [Lysobacter sp. ISL-42]MBT2749668.1 hypothetical protein [Lysobacter sp. ISL-50]MBT2777613.1 hypothetical protein [Lysobacter sp. ISL-54]MBT2782101.1 hypothetical protein [Lysobacter sp. ISL-52]